MPKKESVTSGEKSLIYRYLMWCYKTTKEDLDRIDRYFTQLKADRYILEIFNRHPDIKRHGSEALRQRVDDFRQYMKTKETNVLPKKFADGKGKTLQPDYWYLKNRLAAVEKAIGAFLGKKALREIRALYEGEMLRRIIEAREHT